VTFDPIALVRPGHVGPSFWKVEIAGIGNRYGGVFVSVRLLSLCEPEALQARVRGAEKPI